MRPPGISAILTCSATDSARLQRLSDDLTALDTTLRLGATSSRSSSQRCGAGASVVEALLQPPGEEVGVASCQCGENHGPGCQPVFAPPAETSVNNQLAPTCRRCGPAPTRPTTWA